MSCNLFLLISFHTLPDMELFISGVSCWSSSLIEKVISWFGILSNCASELENEILIDWSLISEKISSS